jgi:hypothetical protein
VLKADRLVKTSDCFQLWFGQDEVRFFALVTMFITGLFLVRRQMRIGLLAILLLMAGVTGPLGIAAAALLDDQRYPASGDRLLLWVSYERGRAAAEVSAAEALAEAGVEVWSLDPTSSYFLPQLGRSMDVVPQEDVADWMRTALASGKQVTIYAVARAAVPVLRGLAALEPAQRAAICVMLMYPNIYREAEPLAEPDYLDFGSLEGVRIRILQPRRSAATPWLPGRLEALQKLGATVSAVILENLRENFWAREAPTEFEMSEGRRLDAVLLREMESWGCHQE